MNTNQKKLIAATFIILLALSTANFVFAQESEEEKELQVYFFYGETCPHCAKEEAFLDRMEDKYPQLKLHRFEVYNNETNRELFQKVAEEFGTSVQGVPTLFIEDCEPVVGFNSEETTGRIIEDMITGCLDPDVQYLPIFGKVKISDVGLAAFSIMLGFLDGFNPCAMYVLLFLLTLLIRETNRKKTMIIGGTFIFISGVVYLLFMVLWLNTFLIFGHIDIVRIGVALFAIAFGLITIKDFWLKKVCTIAIPGKKGYYVFKKLDEIVKSDMPLGRSLIWIAILAIGVNVVELACTAGFPAMFMNILTSSNLPTASYYLYMLLYIIFYMIDDMIIFSIVILTLGTKQFADKYGRWTKLISGIVIILLGLIMIFFPELLTFG